MSRSAWCGGVAAAVLCPLAFGGQLVKDVNAVPLTNHYGGSSFAGAMQTPSGVLFFATDETHGHELWITDGTPAGTKLLKDIRPGPLSSDVQMLTPVNGTLFFLANDGTNGFELWRSDGTDAGTRLVANIGPGASDGTGNPIVIGGSYPSINGVIFFGANDGSTGWELWRSDGTTQGTYRLSDGAAGSASLQPYEYRVVGSRLYFLGTDSAGEELWTSDGTTTGTKRVQDINPGDARHIGNMTVVGNVMFFSATDATHGNELWRAKADGTAEMVSDLAVNPAINGSMPKAVAVFNDSLLFEALPSSNNGFFALMRITPTGNSPTTVMTFLPGDLERVLVTPQAVLLGYYDPVLGQIPIVRTDGTAAGTGHLGNNLFFNRTTGGDVRAGDWVYFYGNTAVGEPYDIYRTDGTTANTSVYATLNDPVAPSELVAFDGRLYFSAGRFTDPDHGEELWVTDGTPGGTHLFRDFTPGPEHSLVGATVFGNRLFLDVFDGQAGNDPWVTDGTGANTVQLADINAQPLTGDSSPSVVGRAGSRTIFHADDGVRGVELWSTQGPESTTVIVRDQPGGAGLDAARGFVQMDGYLLYAGVDSAGAELWRTDGTPAGTLRVADINAGPFGSEPHLYEAAVLDGVAYFRATENTHGDALWRSDGTPAGTWMVVDLTPTGASPPVSVFPAAANGRVFLRASNGDTALLYSTDGTEAGTVLVSGDYNVNSQYGFAFLDRFCFHVITINSILSDYYCSDGTAGNVTRLTDFESLGLSPVGVPFVLNDRLIMMTHAGAQSGGTYACDGTPDGCTQITTQQLSSIGAPLAGGTQLVFATNSDAGRDFTITDGTAAGTRSLLAGSNAPRDGITGSFTAVGDSVVFVVDDPVAGPVLWKSDGSPDNTRFLFDADPTGDSHDRPPAGWYVNGDRAYFSTHRDGIGEELWSISATLPSATDDVVDTAHGTAVTIAVAANDADFQGSLAAATIEILSQPASGSVNVGAGSVTYTPNAGFSGLDRFTYRVFDAQGNPSNAANVSVTTRAAASTTPPGTAPNPPANPPGGGGGGGGGGGSSGGGGGAWGHELWLLALLLLPRVRRRLVAA